MALPHSPRPRLRIAVAALSATLGLGTVACTLGTDQPATASDPSTADTAPDRPEGTEPALTPDRIVLNPTVRPARSQKMTWRTSTEQKKGVVQIRRGDGTVREVAAGAITDPVLTGPGAHHFTTRVGGLQPNTRYVYRVGAPGAWSAWREFTTARYRQGPAWDFLYYGDAQKDLTGTWAQVVNRSERRVPNARLSLHTGDLIDQADKVEQWRDWFTGTTPIRRTSNVLPSPGNHELLFDAPMEQFRAMFSLPTNGPTGKAEKTYYTDYQGVRFVSLYGSDIAPGLGQKQWLEKVLSENPKKFSVVYFHQPVFSGSLGRDNAALRRAWLPLFEKYNVDLVLQGHDHVYARGAMENRRVRPGVFSGPMYVVSSAGGKYYDLDRSPDNNWTRNGAVRQRAYDKVSTFQRITVDGDKLVYRSIVGAKPADSRVRATVGSVLDSFTVVHRPDGSKRVFNGVR